VHARTEVLSTITCRPRGIDNGHPNWAELACASIDDDGAGKLQVHIVLSVQIPILGATGLILFFVLFLAVFSLAKPRVTCCAPETTRATPLPSSASLPFSNPSRHRHAL
jgi:hypothetical protein